MIQPVILEGANVHGFGLPPGANVHNGHDFGAPQG